jgi:LPS-assembly protein
VGLLNNTKDRRGIFRQWGVALHWVLFCVFLAIFLHSNIQTVFALDNSKVVLPEIAKPSKGTAAEFDADQVTYDPATQIAVATGDVKITYGKYVLNASHVTFNQKTKVFTANGSVELLDSKGNSLTADTLELKEKFKAIFATHVRALLSKRVSISADYVRRDVNGISIFEKARYTACTNCTARNGAPLWELVSDRTTHDAKENRITHIKPKLKIAGHTVLGLPYYAHPDPTVKRQTGFLRPGYKYGEAYGLRAITPFYWKTGRSHDLTLSPALSSKQGPIGDFEWRHRLAKGSYKIQGYGAYQLQPGLTLENRDVRAAVKTEGRFKLDDAGVWNWGWNGLLATDRNFLHEYDFDERIFVQNDVYVTGLQDRNYVSAQLMHFTSLRNSIDQDVMPTALPYVSGEHYFDDNLLGGELKLNWNAYSIQRVITDAPFVGVEHAQHQMRAVGDLRWSSQWISDGGLVMTPFARLRSDFYYNDELTVGAGEQSTARILPSAGFDLRYPLISSLSNGQSILTPVVQVIAARDEPDAKKIGNEDAIALNFDHSSLFLDDRFTGLDRYEGGTRANLGLNYSYLGSNGGYFRGSVGESLHLAGANSFAAGTGLDGSRSDLVGAFTWQPNAIFNLSYEARVEEDFSAINRQDLQASLTFDRISGNLGYLFINADPTMGRTKDEEWITANTRVGISEGWYVFGGVNYNLQTDIFTTRTLGVEFDCDCMNFKAAYTGIGGSGIIEGITEHRLMLSIDFATLGGTSFSGGYRP